MSDIEECKIEATGWGRGKKRIRRGSRANFSRMLELTCALCANVVK